MRLSQRIAQKRPVLLDTPFSSIEPDIKQLHIVKSLYDLYRTEYILSQLSSKAERSELNDKEYLAYNRAQVRFTEVVEYLRTALMKLLDTWITYHVTMFSGDEDTTMVPVAEKYKDTGDVEEFASNLDTTVEELSSDEWGGALADVGKAYQMLASASTAKDKQLAVLYAIQIVHQQGPMGGYLIDEPEGYNMEELLNWLSNVPTEQLQKWTKQADQSRKLIIAKDKWETILIDSEEPVHVSLSKADVFNYYSTPRIRKEITAQLKNNRTIIYQTFIKNRSTLKRHADGNWIKIANDNKDAYDDSDYQYWIERRTTEFHIVLPTKTTNIGWIDIDPQPNFGWDNIKETARRCLRVMSRVEGCSAYSLKYSGGRGIHVLGRFTKGINVDKLRQELRNELDKEFISDDNITTSIARGKDQCRVDVTTLKKNGSIRAAYSLNSNTGLVSLPIRNLRTFKPSDATIHKVVGELRDYPHYKEGNLTLMKAIYNQMSDISKWIQIAENLKAQTKQIGVGEVSFPISVFPSLLSSYTSNIEKTYGKQALSQLIEIYGPIEDIILDIQARPTSRVIASPSLTQGLRIEVIIPSKLLSQLEIGDSSIVQELEATITHQLDNILTKYVLPQKALTLPGQYTNSIR